MKRSLIGALLVAGSAALTLAGCNGGTFEELEKAPVALRRDTPTPRAQVAACITDELAQFGSDFGRFPDIEPGTTRLELGGSDGYHFRNYYQIDIDDLDNGSRGSHVAVRHSKAQDDSLSVTDLLGLVQRCMQ